MVYDLIVIGGGPAGYLAAERAGHAGLNTLLVEKRFVGGVCLNEGCIPSKALLYSAKVLDYARHGEKYGVTAQNVVFNHEAVIARKNKVVKTLVSGIKSKLKKNKVTVVEGNGSICGKSPEGYQLKVNDQLYTGKRLLVATGSMPVIPSIPGVREGMEKGTVMTNREILDINEVPSSLVIVGGGVIGLEMASYFNSAGSRVTIIEMLDRIGGYTDREISEILMKNYEKKGIEFKLGCRVVEVKDGSVVYECNGERLSSPAERVLMSIGRRPVTEGLGLETIGVELEMGGIKTDERGKTNIPEVYAAGDVNGRSMLAHTAYREAEVCINNILGKKDIMRYNAIPSVIYTNPEVGCVGETEETAKQKGIEYEAAKISMMYSGRYVAENDGGDGICKIIVDKKHKKLIGVHMIGSYASEIIYGAGIMIETEMMVKDIKEVVFPHPTVCEVIREGIFEL
ncbi:dihydrolipoamide dehydrogenase [Anaerobacterium chartisolvens]|uniref:Dihydrolipoyl dehydrogenase n=1 Tax=Anaerobacterium chartisolvens TaxID=1297424 RepID=A0A369ATC7_9FIRM|nr:dihydrolipoyl dehydrogenase [Anaerobacterium chartisolvens]RCX12335.1 dihydrolipoamide dehydrogenase [Anaerobacterium chartisolvens]